MLPSNSPSLMFFPPSPPDSSSPLRPLQPGGVGGRHVRPAAARPAAPRSHPDPEAAGRGGRLRWLQHRAQRAQLLPARTSAHTLAHARRVGAATNDDGTHQLHCVFIAAEHLANSWRRVTEGGVVGATSTSWNCFK